MKDESFTSPECTSALGFFALLFFSNVSRHGIVIHLTFYTSLRLFYDASASYRHDVSRRAIVRYTENTNRVEH